MWEDCGQCSLYTRITTLVGRKMFGCQPVNLKTLEAAGSSFVALDGVGAGDTGELVMVVGGSSARMADGMSQTPTDRV